MPNLCEKDEFTILPRHYQNTHVFTEMPRHLRKCQNYNISANIYAVVEYVFFISSRLYHMLLLSCSLHNCRPHRLDWVAVQECAQPSLQSSHAPYYITLTIFSSILYICSLS
jgi:hypothetical protein